jgi:hypothetical protein
MKAQELQQGIGFGAENGFEDRALCVLWRQLCLESTNRGVNIILFFLWTLSSGKNLLLKTSLLLDPGMLSSIRTEKCQQKPAI